MTNLDLNSKLSIARTILSTQDGQVVGFDPVTNALTIVDYEHHEIHSGSHFNFCGYQLGVATAAEIDFVVVTPDLPKWGHFTFSTYSSLGATIDLYVGTNTVVGGTVITPRNNNANSSNVTIMDIKKDPTSLVTGTNFAGFLAGAGRVAGFTERSKENILQQDQAYLFRITSLANSNNISWCFDWYEHTNKG